MQTNTPAPRAWHLLAASAEPEQPETPPADVPLDFTAEATLEAAPAKGGKLPRFHLVAYTGVPMRPRLDPPLKYPVVVDLAGLDLSKQERPALRSHDTERVVGHTEFIRSDGRQLTSAVVVSGTGRDAMEVRDSAVNGFKWQVSIGAAVGGLEFVKGDQTVNVNGRSVSGPVYVARAGCVREISFVTLGADDDTAAALIAASAAKRNPMDPFELWLKAKGFDLGSLAAESKQFLQSQFDAEKGGTATLAANPRGGPTPENRDLNSVLNTERENEKRRRAIVDLTAKALQDNPGSLQLIEAMSRQAMDGDWDTQRYELELLRACRPTNVNRVRNGGGGDELNGPVLEAALCRAGGLEDIETHYPEQVLEACDKRFRHGLGLGELLVTFARRNGYQGYGTGDVNGLLRAAFAPTPTHHLAATGWTSISLPGILGTVANKYLRTGFDGVENSWRQIAAVRSVKNFQLITSYSLTGGFDYVELAPQGQLTHATVGQETYTNQAKTYGRMFAIDRRDIINDDIGALTQVPRKLGRGAALKYNKVFWGEFLDNSSFFTTGNGSYLAGATAGTNDTRMNVEGLTRGELLFYNQTDPDGNPLGAAAKYLLVPNALNASAAALMNSTETRDTTASTVAPTGNPHAGKFTVVRSSYLSNTALTGYSAAAWYLVADPNDVPVIEVAFLNGVETPTVESADVDFNQLGIQMRGYHDFGVNLQEYRGAVKLKGAA